MLMAIEETMKKAIEEEGNTEINISIRGIGHVPVP